MGNYDDLIRDIAAAVAGVRDTLTTDVGKMIGESVDASGHTLKTFESTSMRSYKYVLDTVTGEVNQMYKNEVVDRIGNILNDVASLTIPTNPADPCYDVPPDLTMDDAMALHKKGRNFTVRKIGGQLFIDMDTGCRRPYTGTGSQEALNYFHTLSTGNIFYEFTPEMFTEPTPHAQDEQPVIVVQGGTEEGKPTVIQWVWNKTNNTWLNKATGEVFAPTKSEKVPTDKAGWMAPAPVSYAGLPLWASQYNGKEYSSTYLDVLVEPGSVTNWSTLITGKNPNNNRVMLFWEKDTQRPVITTADKTISPTGSITPVQTPVSVSPTVTTKPTTTGTPIRTGNEALDLFAQAWYGDRESLIAYNQPVAVILESLGVEEPKSLLDWINIGMITMVAALARLSNEPVDRAIRKYLNEELPNAIPNPTDLVRFELREVYREEDRAKALVVPPSSTFLELMKEWGYNKYHAESYWAAHWELPSPIQAYEMYHRLRPGEFEEGVYFDKAELEKTLKALDYRPDFIERLIQIAYQPITRVDIRRMWAMGVIQTEEELYGRYQDLGYSPKDCEAMVAFTIASNQPEQKTLSKAFYEDEFEADRLTYEELKKAYREMGYSDVDALRMVDALQRKKERVTQQEIDRRASGKRADKFLTADQTLKAFKLGIIDEEVALHKLIRYGYDKKDALILIDTAYMELSDIYQTEKALEKEERKTIFEILQAYIKGETTEEEARSELKTIGQDDIKITALLNAARAQKRG